MLEILKRVRSQKGFSIVSALIGTVIIAVGVLVLSEGFRSFLSMKMSLNNNFNLSQVRGKMISSLSNSSSLAQTIAASPPMGCLQNQSDCSAQKSKSFEITVVDADGKMLTQPKPSSAGLKEDGSPCMGFDPVSGNDSCPMQYTVEWRPMCPPIGACLNPQNRFTGTLKFKGVDKNLTNVKISKFNFVVFPANMDSTLEANCKAVTIDPTNPPLFNPVDGTCTLPLEGLCPGNQIVVGMDGQNKKICAPLSFGPCPMGYAIDYIDISGGLTCKFIAFCPAKTVFSTWSPGAASGDGGGGGDGCDGSDGGCDGSDGGGGS
jgi:uncharacterized membrane protein YgcG